jgi:hypothetical protein
MTKPKVTTTPADTPPGFQYFTPTHAPVPAYAVRGADGCPVQAWRSTMAVTRERVADQMKVRPAEVRDCLIISNWLTPGMVDRAASALYEAETGPGTWRDATMGVRVIYQRAARVALVAALGLRDKL